MRAIYLLSHKLSDPEDEDPFTSTSPQQDSFEFVCTYVCECVCVCVCIPAKHFADSFMLLSLGVCDVLHYKHCE